MKLTKTLGTKLLAVGLGMVMTLGVGLTASRVASEVSAADGLFSFASSAQRVSLSTTQQVWASGDITMTINKNSGSNIADYTNPLRVYQNHSAHFSWNDNVLSIEKIVVIANSASYATVLGNSTFTNATASVNSATVTITATNPSLPISVALGAQSRWNSLTVTYTPDVSGPVLQSIAVTTPPTKTSYFVGDGFDKAGMVVTATYDSGPSANVSGSVVIAPSVLGASDTFVTISYTEAGVTKTTTQNVSVSAVVLNSISIKTAASKTSFKLGETFSSSGLVINANYNNGTVEVTSGFSVSGVDTAVLGAQTATITYESKTTTYAIDVTNQGASVGSVTLASDLLISEYVEGSTGTNKALEIFNGTGAAVDLSGYSLKIGTNGAALTNELTLSGSLANGSVLVVYNSASTYEDIVANGNLVNNTIANFNGDDAVGLFKSTALIDVIGIPGSDPGSAWTGTNPVGTIAGGTETASTADRSLRRTSTTLSPNTTFTWSEWEAYVDTASDLSKHVIASADVTPTEQATAFANYVMTGIGNNAHGNCVAVKSELDTEYGYMHADSKSVFQTSSDSLFVNARARMIYLTNWVAAQSPAGVSTTPDHATKNALIASAVIGILGLTTISGFYFLKKKKETF